METKAQKVDTGRLERVMNILVTDGLYEQFQRAAKADMMPSVASWVRKVLIQAAGKGK